MSDQPTPQTFNLDEFSKQSEAYFTKIKPELEGSYKGKYAALDFENEKFWIGETASEALSKAKAEYPDRLFYLIQVGSSSAFSIQSLHSNSLVRKYHGLKRAY